MKTDQEPIPMLLWCPTCFERHIDVGEFATKPHHTHACQHCGMVWRPAIVPTCGVLYLPGFKNEGPAKSPEREALEAIHKFADTGSEWGNKRVDARSRVRTMARKGLRGE